MKIDGRTRSSADQRLQKTASAAVIWFDGVFPHESGSAILNATLIAQVFSPNGEGGGVTISKAVAHLRCTRDGAKLLRDQLNAMLDPSARAPF